MPFSNVCFPAHSMEGAAKAAESQADVPPLALQYHPHFATPTLSRASCKPRADHIDVIHQHPK